MEIPILSSYRYRLGQVTGLIRVLSAGYLIASLCSKYSLSKDKENGSQDTKTRPYIVQSNMFLHEEDRKRNKNQKSYHFLKDFELPKVHHLESNSVRRHLNQILEEGDAPAY